MGNETSQQVKLGDKLENDISLTWKKTGNSQFAARDGHCACAVNNKLFVFGGVVHTPDGSFEESSELLMFNLETEKWSEAEKTDIVPAARSAATMAAVDGKLYLFGGLSQESGWFEGVYMYDTEKKCWSEVETTGKGPSPRDKLASAVIDGKIYIFGGFGPQTDIEEELVDEDDDDEEYEDIPEDQDAAQFGWFNDLFIFDPAAKSWSSPMQMNLGVPTARAAHAMCAIDNKLVIFGGRDSEARRNDIHVFDTETRKWVTKMNITGRQPEPRSFHTATTVGSRVVVLGGRGTSNQHFSEVHIFDTASSQWLQPTVQGDLPSGRGVHTATLVGDRLVLFGGSSDFSTETMQCQTYYNDAYSIKTVDVSTGQAIPKVSENQENVPLDANIPSQKSPAGKSALQQTNGQAMETSQ